MLKNIYRTHNCNELRKENVGQEVTLSGFVKRIRNLGGSIFIDLRDHYGITQLRCEEKDLVQYIKDGVTTESTIKITGKVALRPDANKILDTGEIEVAIENIEILNKCLNVLPFEVEDSLNVKEDLRLQYRFLDLRNDSIHKKIVFRSEVLKKLRNKMDEMGFIEVQTPILTSSSPEGARDFLIPSRLHPGEFYALPQAPQQFKQLLMISGFDKYYQIAPCFRDEDPRADRSPGEFYQLDFEMAFATQEDVLHVLEEIATYIFKECGRGKVFEAPFVRIPYSEAMEKYGSDKPDLRNPLINVDVTEFFEGLEFNAFKNTNVKCIKIPSSGLSRRFFDDMVTYAKESLGMSGLAWIRWTEESKLTGSIAKFISEEKLDELNSLANIDVGKEYAYFFMANSDKLKLCKDAGSIRIKLGQDLGLISEDEYRFCFIVDFPFFELDDDGKIEFAHNPFSMPQGGLEALKNMEPLSILAYQYDLVCNGYELASGAVRNHDTDIMVKAFEMAGYSEEVVEKRFGALFNAFKFGAPPHAGAAPGIDRMIMLLCRENNIREVIAFPKNSKARDLLMQAPNFVTEEQLKDVHIKLREEKK